MLELELKYRFSLEVFSIFFLFTNRYLLFLFSRYAINMYFPLLKYKTRLGYSSVVEHVSSMRRA